MKSCPKCGGAFVGPRYSHGSFGERLKYTCKRCGYETSRPTNDAESNEGSSFELEPDGFLARFLSGRRGGLT